MAVEFIGAIDVPAETLDINNSTISLASLNMQADDYIIFFSVADTTPMSFPNVFDNNINTDAQAIIFASNGVASRAAAVRASEILPSQTLSLNGSTAGMVSILSFRGVDPSFVQSSVLSLTNSGASGTPQAASFSTSADNTFAIRFICGDDDAVIFDTPSGWSLSSRGNRTASTQIVSYAINHRLVPSSTTIASNTYSATPTFNDQWMVFTLLLPSAAETATNVTINETPATASALSVLPTVSGSANEIVAPATATALQTEPTIAVTAGDHTEITTSIPVSALMAPATVSVQRFVNVIVDEPATATVELINNVIVGASNSVDFGVQEFTASAELVEPILPEQPMLASAESGNHTVYVDPNYFNAVTQLNPYLYINNGASGGSIINYGSQSGTFTKGSSLLTNQDGGTPLNLVREGKSWKGASSSNTTSWIKFDSSNDLNSFNNLIGTGNFAYEMWAKPLTFPGSFNDNNGPTYAFLNNEDVIELYMTTPWDGYGTDPGYSVSSTRDLRLKIKNSSSGTTELIAVLSSTPISLNNWNHIVINVYQSGINANQRLVQLWINGQVVFNQNISFTTWTDSTNFNSIIMGTDAQSLLNLSDMFMDEVAIYAEELTNSQIINHYNLISTLSPNYTDSPEPFVANAESGDHQFIVNSNAIPEIKEATASALLTMPTLIAGKSFTHNAAAMTASATSVVPGVSYGITYSATPNIAYAESVNAFHLNSIYADYVRTNINPYRYVTFDSSVPTADIGTDADYSVVPTVIGGTVVNPDEGINGKSAKTAGTSYVTDGVILKESVHDDDWGVSTNHYSSSFWIQRADDDQSTTGLRVIANAYGYGTGDYFLLYQYQNKLHFEFKNITTVITQATTGNVDLFDYDRHLVVLDLDHSGQTDYAKVYVDATLVMTINLGTNRVSLINGTPHTAPNDEVNNHPRYSVGCLITPFAETSLPVQPTNTKLIIDEIYWAKASINQTAVTALYNIMPDKNNADFVADPMTASALSVMPAISTQAILSEGPATASALINNVTVIANRNIVVNAAFATASAQFVNALRIDNRIISSDVMVATAIFNDAGVRITIPGGPMLVTAQMVLPFATHLGRLVPVSAYVRYLRSEAQDGIALYSMKEIK
jgi:hypothetical protein